MSNVELKNQLRTILLKNNKGNLHVKYYYEKYQYIISK